MQHPIAYLINDFQDEKNLPKILLYDSGLPPYLNVALRHLTYRNSPLFCHSKTWNTIIIFNRL